MVNGVAMTIAIVLTASSPPANRKTTADPAVISPHVILRFHDGFDLPLLLSIPNTNVAESAEVIKKIKISKRANILKKLPSGNSLRKANKAPSTFAFIVSANSLLPKS